MNEADAKMCTVARKPLHEEAMILDVYPRSDSLKRLPVDVQCPRARMQLTEICR